MPAPALQADATLDGIDGTSGTDAWAVGSYFGGIPPFVFHWDGTKWTESPQEQTNGAVLYDVAAISSEDAWAAGYDEMVHPLVLHWNGTIWQRVVTPSPGSYDYVNDVAALSSTDVWLVGSYDGSQGTTGLVMHWDGATWMVMPVEQPTHGAIFYAVWPATSNDVWAVGYTGGDIPGEFFPLIEHYDGTSWNIVDFEPPPNGNDNIFYDVAGVSSTDIWAVGYYGYVPLQPLVEHWDGTSWTLVHVPIRKGRFNELFSVSVASSTDVWAAGIYTSDSDVDSPLLEHWDGTRWLQARPSNPGVSSSFHAISSVSQGDIWAVGTYQPPNGGGLSPLIEHSKGCGGSSKG